MPFVIWFVGVFRIFYTFASAKFESMTSRLRQLLAISLLFLFSLENVASGSTPTGSKEDASRPGLTVQKEAQPFLLLLVEENEELNNKDDGTLEPFLAEEAIPHAVHALSPSLGRIYSTSGPFLGFGSFPLYKFLCSFII